MRTTRGRAAAAQGVATPPQHATQHGNGDLMGHDLDLQLHDIAHQKERELLGDGMLVPGEDGLPAGVDEHLAAQAQRLAALDDPAGIEQMTQEEFDRLMASHVTHGEGDAPAAEEAQDSKQAAAEPAEQLSTRGRTRRPSKRKAEADADAEAAADVDAEEPAGQARGRREARRRRQGAEGEGEEGEGEGEEEEEEEREEEEAPIPRRATRARSGRARGSRAQRRGSAAKRGRKEEMYVDDDAEERPADAFVAAIKKIPRGQTRTYSEVAEASGRPHAARTVGRAIRALDLDSTRVPWHRVVAQDGSFIHNGPLAQDQLERLQDEGARPQEEESVREWAERVRAHVVGCFSYGAEAFIYMDARDERVDDFNPKRVEAFPDADAALARGFVAAADMTVEE